MKSMITLEQLSAITGNPIRFPERSGSGRGIVTCAGGEMYLLNSFVGLSRLRQLGCYLPIEVWHLGPEEIPRHWVRLFEPLKVTFRDARILSRTIGGWALKPFAVMNSDFNEILFLDGDCIPCVNPEVLFGEQEYTNCGSLFFQDFQNLSKVEVYELLQLPNDGEREFESGQFLIDKTKCWKPLCVTMWFNENSSFWYRLVYGDKDTFRLSWKLCGKQYGCFRIEPQVNGHTLTHTKDGILFHHRCGDKLRYEENNQNGCPEWDVILDLIRITRKELPVTDTNENVSVLIDSTWIYTRVGYDSRFMTFNQDGTIGIGGDTLEKRYVIKDGILTIYDAFDEVTLMASYDQSKNVWSGNWSRFEKMPVSISKTDSSYRPVDFEKCQKPNDDYFHYRDGCYDLAIIKSVYYNNEYHISDSDVRGGIIIDIGAHIGSFSRLALKLQASKVIAVEANPENYEYLVRNTKGFTNCTTFNVASVGKSENKFIAFKRSAEHKNTGGGSVRYCYDDADLIVPSITFDEIFSVYGRCDLLKLDCEGSEFGILYHSKNITSVKKIVGEYHESELEYMKDLSEFLTGLGFKVSHHPTGGYGYKAKDGTDRSALLGQFTAIRIL